MGKDFTAEFTKSSSKIEALVKELVEELSGLGFSGNLKASLEVSASGRYDLNSKTYTWTSSGTFKDK